MSSALRRSWCCITGYRVAAECTVFHHTVACCSAVQHGAARCNLMQRSEPCRSEPCCSTVQHCATQYNMARHAQVPRAAASKAGCNTAQHAVCARGCSVTRSLGRLGVGRMHVVRCMWYIACCIRACCITPVMLRTSVDTANGDCVRTYSSTFSTLGNRPLT